MQYRMNVVGGGMALLLVLIGLAALPDCGAADDAIVVPQEIRDAVNKMADTVHTGKRIDKDADAFFKGPQGFAETNDVGFQAARERR